MHELLDIIDAKDQVIGCATRREIHRTGRMHRAVHMLVIDPNGRVYLQKRAATKDVHPNCWDSSAAGHVDTGESYMSAAVRELEEELAIKVQCAELTEILRREPHASNGFESQRCYWVKTDQPITPCEREIAEGRWLTPPEMDSLVAENTSNLTPDLKGLWPVYRSATLR